MEFGTVATNKSRVRRRAKALCVGGLGERAVVAVPSFHSATPYVGPTPVKYQVPFTFVNDCVELEASTNVVPASVPSLFHIPLDAPSLAVKNKVPSTLNK